MSASSLSPLGLVARCLAAIGMVAALAAPAGAASPSIGRLGLGGPGCPAGSASASIDASSLSIRFTQFRVSAGGADTFDRKACSLTIPVKVPAGMSVALVAVQYKGTARLPAGARGTISAETFFSGGTGPVISQSINGPLSKSFTYTTASAATVWSACGASLNLRVNSSIRVTTSGGRTATMSVRSQDVGTALIYQLRFRRC